jgi:pimeloyl-ACP methyl ester carboxylesterase/DNA-binding CsgD family transcriptional regulator
MIVHRIIGLSMSLPPEQIRFCTSRDGTRIAYAKAGSGPLLIWIAHWAHHLQLDRENLIWRPWLSMLMRRHAVVRYDFRGCGLSDRNPPEFSLPRYLDDFEAVAAAAANERFAIFAMAGIGGAIAMEFASRHPDRVDRLVLIGPHRRGRLAANPDGAQVSESQARLKLIELGWHDKNPAYVRLFSTLHIPDASPAEEEAYNGLLRASTSPENAAASINAFWHVDVSDVVAKVRCRTLVLHTRGDLVIPFDEGRAVAASLPDAQFEPLESRNHILLATEPAWQQFVQALEGFLDRPVAHASGGSHLLEELTAREHQILELMAQGIDNRSIGSRLRIAEKTVRNQVSTIFGKLGVNSRAQAIVRAREAGFGQNR